MLGLTTSAFPGLVGRRSMDMITISIDQATDAQMLRAIYHRLSLMEEHMSQELEALRLEVERNRRVDESAIVLLTGLSERLTALADQPQAIRALANELVASSDSLAAAVAANTPVVPPQP